MVEPIYDFQFRLILIGDSTVGKSTLLRAFTEAKFSEVSEPTVGVDFYARLIEVKNGVRVKLQLWDTAGQERFRSITKSYYRNSVGALLLYDITRRSTFEHLIDWFSEARQHIEPHKAIFEVVGCKADMENAREVSTEEGRAFASFHGLKFIETSAKTNTNVEEAFMLIAKAIYNAVESGELKAEEGWDGIKPGCIRPTRNLNLIEGEPESGICC